MGRLALVLWLAVCLAGGIIVANRWPGLAGPPVTAAAPAVTPAVMAPWVLPGITLKDLAGRPRSIREWSGRTLLINFWATWCAPCLREMPLLQQLQESGDGRSLQVVGIAIDRLDAVLRFVGETGVTYPILVGGMDATRAAEQFGDAFVGLPFSVVAAPDGTILALRTGELTGPDIGKIAAVARKIAAGELTSTAARGLLILGRNPTSGQPAG